MEEARRIDVVWQGSAVGEYDALAARATAKNLSIQDYIKALIRRALSG